jgi:hypothetical protein
MDETLWSRPSRSHENRGAGRQHGVGMGVPTPRSETMSRSAVFRPAGGVPDARTLRVGVPVRVSEAMGSGRRGDS